MLTHSIIFSLLCWYSATDANRKIQILVENVECIFYYNLFLVNFIFNFLLKIKIKIYNFLLLIKHYCNNKINKYIYLFCKKKSFFNLNIIKNKRII